MHILVEKAATSLSTHPAPSNTLLTKACINSFDNLSSHDSYDELDASDSRDALRLHPVSSPSSVSDDSKLLPMPTDSVAEARYPRKLSCISSEFNSLAEWRLLSMLELCPLSTVSNESRLSVFDTRDRDEGKISRCTSGWPKTERSLSTFLEVHTLVVASLHCRASKRDEIPERILSLNSHSPLDEKRLCTGAFATPSSPEIADFSIRADLNSGIDFSAAHVLSDENRLANRLP